MRKEDHWGDPHKVKKGKCQACNGRGIVPNPNGPMQVCPLCGGSGKGRDTEYIWRTPNESNPQS